MNFAFSEEEQVFREEVRAFFQHEYPRDLIRKQASGQSPDKPDYQRSERSLSAKGWLAVDWPVEHGGTGWSDAQKYIFDEELERAGALNVTPFGLLYVGPVIIRFGNLEQQQRWLPGIINATTFWAQGYSEPEAGSDLASLRCRADRVGDEYVVNGTKTWTSLGQFADWIFCLVRTDDSGRKQQGISFLCIDVNSPGVTVRSIAGIDGRHLLNSFEFADVRVPVENRIGEEGQAWGMSQYLLSNERTSYAHIGGKRAAIERLKEFAKTMGAGGGSLLEDPLFSARVAQVEIDFMALEFTLLRTLSALSSGEAPGSESSAIKILATENQQAIDELMIEAAAHHGLRLFQDDEATGPVHNGALAMSLYLGNRAQSIYGGTNEIQKHVIAKQVLGL